jgi:hypothetical protein
MDLDTGAATRDNGGTGPKPESGEKDNGSEERDRADRGPRGGVSARVRLRL